MKFRTNRLSVESWEEMSSTPCERTVLERELAKMLTPKITRYLPLSMQFSEGGDDISKWVDDLAAEADILSVHTRKTNGLVGLLFWRQARNR